MVFYFILLYRGSPLFFFLRSFCVRSVPVHGHFTRCSRCQSTARKLVCILFALSVRPFLFQGLTKITLLEVGFLICFRCVADRTLERVPSLHLYSLTRDRRIKTENVKVPSYQLLIAMLKFRLFHCLRNEKKIAATGWKQLQVGNVFVRAMVKVLNEITFCFVINTCGSLFTAFLKLLLNS